MKRVMFSCSRLTITLLFLSRCLDKQGLLLKSDQDKLTPAQIPFARGDVDWPDGQPRDLLNVVKHAQPHVLIGTSTKPQSFTEEIIREMAKHVERPIVFPLSNPTRLHEAKPKDINDWTEGRALIATGSPFPPVEYNGVKYEIGKTLVIFKPRVKIASFLEYPRITLFESVGSRM